MTYTVHSLKEAVLAHLEDQTKLEFSIGLDDNVGEISFLSPTSTSSEHKDVIIHRIFLTKLYRRQGLFSSIIDMLVEKSEVNRIVICGIQSIEIIKALTKINTKYEIKFKDHGGDAIWDRCEHYCDSHDTEQLSTF